jgi:hypothetical protein
MIDAFKSIPERYTFVTRLEWSLLVPWSAAIFVRIVDFDNGMLHHIEWLQLFFLVVHRVIRHIGRLGKEILAYLARVGWPAPRLQRHLKRS